ncbi:MAG: hypothetical protein AAGC63_05215 [Propionicimonas sp.]
MGGTLDGQLVSWLVAGLLVATVWAVVALVARTLLDGRPSQETASHSPRAGGGRQTDRPGLTES